MTVKELKELLSTLDENLLVVFDGYEEGVGGPQHVGMAKIELNFHKEGCFYNPHLLRSKDQKDSDLVDCFYIGRHKI
jgi:Rps23 Pro-64 3,4-dihydroxylase Tpa1-like proline 4-hydroxylase